ncbi:MAG: SH3 domain-containing protein [Actinomycetota bacterium]
MQRTSRPPEAKSSRRAETPKLISRTTRFNVPAPDAVAPSPLGQAIWLRPLLVGLLLVALVPNITLAIVLWLGLIDPPWSRREMPPPPAPPVQATAPSPVLTAPPVLEATAGETIKFPIALDNTDGVPARSIVAIQGLPPGSTLSDGRPYGDEWNLKSDQIGDLHLTLPSNVHGEMQIAISLIAANDTVITDTETVLRVNPAPGEPAAQNAASQPAADNAGQQQASATVQPVENDGATASADVAPSEQTSAIPSTAAPQTPKAPAPGATDASPAEFVQPSVYVNLREGPSSSSRVIGVIAKGVKVPVLDRKRGWVQVSNPATSEKGWIYGGYVGEGRHVRSRKKADAAPEQKSDSSSSFWNWLTQ